MELPDTGQDPSTRLVAMAKSIAEAEQIAARYESEGFRVEIRKRSQGGVTAYEVWAGRNPLVPGI